jgi:quinol monooxygenase YgiN
MIHVIAAIEVAAGRRDDFLAEFHKVVPLVRQEQGCLEYGPAVDLATDISLQTPLRDHVVTVLEKWESLDALKAHLDAPHMAEYRERVEGLVAGLTLHILEPA